MRSHVSQYVKMLARILLGEYSAYRIYVRSIDDDAPSFQETTAALSVTPVAESAIETSSDLVIREQIGFAGADSRAYACYDGQRIVGICFYWYGERYRKRNFWPLVDGEAKLVQIITVPDMRGRGVATRLIASSSADLMQNGFHRTFARIWHSHTPSLRSFEHAGWRQVALVLECNPFRRTHPIRLRFGPERARGKPE